MEYKRCWEHTITTKFLRKTVVAFGTVFNNFDIRHQDSAGNVTSIIKVPLSYAPIQKFLARIEQQGRY